MVLAAASCSPAAQDALARDAARAAVAPVLVERFPGVPLEPALDCVIETASGPQIRALALDGVTGPTESTVQIVIDVVSQPQTLSCLAARGLPALLQ